MEELSSLTVSQREQFLVENDVFGIYNYFDASDVSTQKYMSFFRRTILYLNKHQKKGKVCIKKLLGTSAFCEGGVSAL